MLQSNESFQCYLVTKSGKDQVQSAVERRPLRELPAGDVLIRVAWSSLNYKDALASKGHPGVVKRFPHVPGIDASGVVAQTNSNQFQVGQRVLVTSYELGAGQWGGWSEYVRVPADWVLPHPQQWTLRQSMIYGTAGLTAAMSIDALQQHHVAPPGDIVVTGATGSVGSLSVEILTRLGYRVAASSGKAEQHAWLKELGAAEIIPREALHDASNRPLLSARWTGAVDTVGGQTLATILRSARNGACVTACGLVGGTDLPLTIYPFILRGVTLSGIDSAWAERERRIRLWDKLASQWQAPIAERDARETTLNDVDKTIAGVLAGQNVGRVTVRLSGEL